MKDNINFKQYLIEKRVKVKNDYEESKNYPHMSTICGSHCIDNEDEKQEITEEFSTTPGKITTEEQLDRHTDQQEKKIHSENKLTPNEHLIAHTKVSRKLNGFLHTPDKKSAENYTEHKTAVKNIDSALDKAKIKSDTHVYTGLHESPLKHFTGAGSAKVHLPGYTSTSTNYDTARFFAKGMLDTKKDKKHSPINADAPARNDKEESITKHVLKLHLPAGTKAGSVKHFSHHKDENEVLLHRGHNIEIHPNPTIMPNGTHVWHARVISHTPAKI